MPAGSKTPTALPATSSSAPRRSRAAATSEDVFVVYYLQSMDVVAAPAQLADGERGAGHSLTLDGQADTDYYSVYTTGSQGAVRNYVINVLDTGAPDDGVDELAIYGYDNLARRVQRLRAGDAGAPPRPTTSSCCAPPSASTPRARTASAARVPTQLRLAESRPRTTRRSSRCCTAQPRRLPQPRRRATRPSADVQRINYDAALNGRLSVYGLGGNDAFFVDDNSAITTLDGGAGYDTFQIGQIFGLKRDTERGRAARRTTPSRRSSRRRAAG